MCVCSSRACVGRAYHLLRVPPFFAVCTLCVVLYPRYSSMLEVSDNRLECPCFAHCCRQSLPLTPAVHHKYSTCPRYLTRDGIPRCSASDGIPPAPGSATQRHHVDGCDIATPLTMVNSGGVSRIMKRRRIHVSGEGDIQQRKIGNIRHFMMDDSITIVRVDSFYHRAYLSPAATRHISLLSGHKHL